MYFLFLTLTMLSSCGTYHSVRHLPDVASYEIEKPVIQQINDSASVSQYGFLTKNAYGHYICYTQGNDYQRGLTTGALTQPLLQKQESLFFEKVKEFVPSKFKQSLLRQFLKWYNRKMYLHIPNHLQAEIYGISEYSDDTYNYLATKFLRSMYLHGAHDIGHAMQDLALVGCTSVAAWDSLTEKGKMLVGRNFDFYAGDEFAEDKLIYICSPDNGFAYASVTWGGMIGVVSGMNESGITVTINAGKSAIPLQAKTPISLVTREILQFASSIDEAVAIAKKYEVFVSEAILVTNYREKRAVSIEVSPDNFGVYELPNSDLLVCANHFQSENYVNDKRNTAQIKNSHSQYRFDRMNELITENEKLTVEKLVSVLRNKEGINDEALGYGNEKALNQLLAHHAVVFEPENQQLWVSSNPYQLGAFVKYDLPSVWENPVFDNPSIVNPEIIRKDDFIDNQWFKNYEEYRKINRIIEKSIKNKTDISAEMIRHYQSLNPDLWSVYYKIGVYYYQKGWYAAARNEFKKAENKVVTTQYDLENIQKYQRKIQRKIR
ncbi:MAG: C45 family peptidase [Capnocytophaga sp.]|nr:C45 family peptidase [Capnocytophaga sp.]